MLYKIIRYKIGTKCDIGRFTRVKVHFYLAIFFHFAFRIRLFTRNEKCFNERKINPLNKPTKIKYLEKKCVCLGVFSVILFLCGGCRISRFRNNIHILNHVVDRHTHIQVILLLHNSSGNVVIGGGAAPRPAPSSSHHQADKFVLDDFHLAFTTPTLDVWVIVSNGCFYATLRSS